MKDFIDAGPMYPPITTTKCKGCGYQTDDDVLEEGDLCPTCYEDKVTEEHLQALIFMNRRLI